MTVPLRVLVSFHYARFVDLGEIADHPGPVEVFADSGAFSARSVGADIKLADYAAWLRDWSGLFAAAANLDVIGDHEASRRNLHLLEDCGLDVIPVFHAGSPWGELDELCARYRYVGLGGMASSTREGDRLAFWLAHCFRMGRDHGTAFHGFGQTSPTVLARFPFYSVDSSSWTSGIRYKQSLLWSDRRAAFLWIRHGTARVQRHRALIRSHGGDPDHMANPGFAVRGDRPQGVFRAERAATYSVSATAMRRFETWAQRQHHVPPPPGQTHSGPHVYLGVTRARELRSLLRPFEAAGDAIARPTLRSAR